MPVISVGDMAQQFTSMKNGGTIKSDLQRLAQSLSTGRVADVTQHLNGETARFSGVSYSLSQLDAYRQVASETQQYLANVQTVLGQVDALRSTTAERLLLVNDTSTIAQVDEAAFASRSAFDTMVRTLNTQIADRALLGGADVEGAPLVSGPAMLADMQMLIGPATDQATITAVVEAWFDDPAGGFVTLGYMGDRGTPPERRLSETKSFTLDARADDPAIIEMLKAAAIAALAGDLPGIDRETKAGLLQDAGKRLFVGSSSLVALQARVGFTESGVEQAMAETKAQQTALGMLQNDLIAADPFETASRLQSVQLQLETHYAVTARMSQLSLLGYI